MTEKRFENRLDKSNIKFNTLNPVWDNEKETALNVFEMMDLLNKYDTEYTMCHNDVLRLEKENEQLKKDRNELFIRERDTGNNCRKLKYENKQLKEDKQSLIDFIKKEFPKSHKHILEGIGND